mmetsp:Transcript_32391/g.75223  ORF Transcript_32391/g.75223 Transcript_32391/m.75223 type:complete len:123 (-) Transcript_32391:103-471(-)
MPKALVLLAAAVVANALALPGQQPSAWQQLLMLRERLTVATQRSRPGAVDPSLNQERIDTLDAVTGVVLGGLFLVVGVCFCSILVQIEKNAYADSDSKWNDLEPDGEEETKKDKPLERLLSW